MSADTMPRFPFVHRFVNRLPIFFSRDSIYSSQTETRENALEAVACHPKILKASLGKWSGAMIE